MYTKVKATGMLFCLETSFMLAKVGIGTTLQDASAVLGLTSIGQGLLSPRMTAIQRDAIETSAQGLMVCCTNCDANGEVQLYNGAEWVNFIGRTAASTSGWNSVFTYNGSTVSSGTVISANSKCWLDRNLEATLVATTSTDADSYSNLYQWRLGDDGHQIKTPLCSTTTSLSPSDNPGNVNFILAPVSHFYCRSPQNINLWQGVSGINNPCPSNFRLPTSSEWEAEILTLNSFDEVGAFTSPLKLPLAGARSISSGLPIALDTNGYYCSSKVNISYSQSLSFNSSNDLMNSFRRASERSVGCIKV